MLKSYKQFMLHAFFLIFLSMFFCWETYAQCAMCKATAASKDETGGFAIGGGINTGILYLLALPFIGIGIVGFYWYRKSKEL